MNTIVWAKRKTVFCLCDADRHFLGDDLDCVDADFDRLMRTYLLAVHVRHVLPSEFVLVRVG